MAEYKCHVCSKIYIRKNAYYNHMLICNVAKCSTDNADLENIPTMREMYAIIINLYGKYEKLETEYAELKKHVNNTKKKISIIDYLNVNFANISIDFADFINNIDIGFDELDIIFKNDYVDGIYQILFNAIEKFKESNNVCVPIKAFNQNDGIIYIYLKTNNEWAILDEKYLEIVIRSFEKKLLVLFLQWKINNEAKMERERFSEIYILNMKKVVGGNYGSKNKKNMIKNKLYKYLRINLKNVVSYEFV